MVPTNNHGSQKMVRKNHKHRGHLFVGQCGSTLLIPTLNPSLYLSEIETTLLPTPPVQSLGFWGVKLHAQGHEAWDPTLRIHMAARAGTVRLTKRSICALTPPGQSDMCPFRLKC